MPMEWKEVKTQTDANLLLEVFGEFHDSCIHEAHLFTGHYVADNLAMACPSNLDNNIRLLVQRQFKDPASIELLFEEITRFNLVPTPENYDSVIFGATLLVKDNYIYWSTEMNWSPKSATRDDATWISSKKLRWRQCDLLGEKYWYGPTDK